jgi:hypothetical protein
MLCLDTKHFWDPPQRWVSEGHGSRSRWWWSSQEVLFFGSNLSVLRVNDRPTGACWLGTGSNLGYTHCPGEVTKPRREGRNPWIQLSCGQERYHTEATEASRKRRSPTGFWKTACGFVHRLFLPSEGAAESNRPRPGLQGRDRPGQLAYR